MPRPAASPAEHAGRTIGDVEILRGIAIGMVLIEHLPLNLLWWRSRFFDIFYFHWHGAMGVDLFFAISGFVIARGLLPRLRVATQHGLTSAELWRFWVRRIFRLLPAAWVWLAIPLFGSWYFAGTGAFGDYALTLPMSQSAFLNIANFHAARLVNGWGGPSTVYWSLSLEEQFYAILPITAWATGRMLPYLLVLVVLYQFLMPWTPLTDLTRPGALAVGVLLAIYAPSPQYKWCEKLLPVSGLSRFLFLLLLVTTLGRLGVDSNPWKLGLVALLSGVLVFAASFDRGYVWPDPYSGRFMRWVGSRSYAIYLTHLTIFRAVYGIAQYQYGDHPPAKVWIDVLVIFLAISWTFIAAEMTHRWIERPCKDLGRRLTGQPQTVGIKT